MSQENRCDVPGKIPAGFSVYLDLLRVSAAMAVFLIHAGYDRFTHGAITVPEHLGHEAVVIFFVLSGYVIAYVAAEREKNITDYLISRAARIYSVAIPALVITFLIDCFLIGQGDFLGGTYQVSAPMKYLPVFLSFTTDIWFLRENAFSNGPYWSLCYEVWYYLAFAAAFFFRERVRIVAVFVVLGIMGPKLWLLFPIWLAGVGVYRAHQQIKPLGRDMSRALFAFTGFCLIALWGTQFDLRLDRQVDAWSGGWVVAHLRYSQYAVGDWISGALIAAHLFAARTSEIRFPRILAVPIRYLAAYSFTLYLVHFPLLELGSWFELSPPALLSLVLVSIWLVGQVTERQRDTIRLLLRRLFRVPIVAQGRSL